MKVDLPGLIKERLPSGNYRWRVRVEGNKARRVTLLVAPDHPKFMEHYRAGRAGIQIPAPDDVPQSALKGTLGWLIDTYLADMAREVDAGLVSPKTLKKRRNLLNRIRADHGRNHMMIPRKWVLTIRDGMSQSPANADAMVAAIGCMYKWAIEREICADNPAAGVPTIHRSAGGATPWTMDDIERFRRTHPKGTTPHLCLTILLFTGCRIGDAIRLGRKNEFERNGVRGIGWTPAKQSSSVRVEIPMFPQLIEATRAARVGGETYLLNSRGKPFTSADSLGQMMRRWCDKAGLPDRSSHGVRKALGHLLAEAGCSQYEITAVLGHTEARTSEIYTRGFGRWDAAARGMGNISGIEW